MGRKINVNEVIGESKFNKFFFLIICLGIGLMLFDGYDQGIWGGALTVLKADTGIEDSVFGVITSFGMYGMMIGGIFFGMLSDIIGRKRTLIICVAFYSLFTGLIGFAHTPMQFIIFKCGAGIGLAGISPVVMSLVAEYSPKKNRAMMTTMTIASIPLGTALSTLICMGFLEQFGWRPLFYVALVPILLLPLFIFKMPDTVNFYMAKGQLDKVKNVLKRANPNFKFEDGDELVVNDVQPQQKKSSLVEAVKGLFANGMARNTVLLWIGFLFAMFTSYSMQTWLARLMVYGGFGLSNSLFFLLIFNICALPAAAVIGWCADRIGFKKTVNILGVCVAVIIAAIGFAPSEGVLIALCVVAGMGTTGVYNAVYSYITLAYPAESRGTGIGWATAVARIGGAMGPAMVGSMVTAGTPISIIFPCIAIPYALVSVVFLFIKEKKEEEPAA